MNRHRLLVVPVVVALALGLTACIPLPLPLPGPDPTPSPTVDVVDPGRVDEHAAEQLMREALPVVPVGYDVYDEAGLDGETLGGDWTDIDHDAQRVARVVRGAESPGWDDFSLGPGFYLDVEIVLMSSADAAGLAYNDVASAASQPYSYDSDDGSLRTDYAPLAEPSGRWPFGTVEQSREQTWSSGERASGWVVYYLAGPFIAVVVASAVPGNDSAAALAAYADSVVPPLVEAVDALPAQLATIA
jgi:hypothetical protein